MGKGIQPICYHCNHSFRTIYLGGGFINMGRVHRAPVPSYACQKLTSLNLLRKELRSSKCSKKIKPFGEVVPNNAKEPKKLGFSSSSGFFGVGARY